MDREIRQLLTDKLGPRGRALTRSTRLRITPSNDDVAAHKIGSKWFANYKLNVENIPLSEASQISTVVVEDGSTAVVKERNIPRSLNFDAHRLGLSAAKVPVEAAVKSAREELAKLLAGQKGAAPDVDALKVQSSRLEVWVEPSTAVGKLAWAVRLASEDGGASAFGVDVWVDAIAKQGRPEVFEIKSLVVNEHAGSVTALIWDPTQVESPQQRELPSAQVVRSDAEVSETADIAVTDSRGAFRFENGTGMRRFSVRLMNKYFVVRNARGSLVEVEATGEGGQPVKLEYKSIKEFEIAQPSAFYWANRARSFVSEALGDDKLLNIEVLVNDESDCNASWNTMDKRIRLRRASVPGSGRSCINRANLHTVFHEFGHAVDHALGGIQGTTDGRSYSEGFGDALVILFTGGSCYGINADEPNKCMRDAANPPVMFPCCSDIHHRGRVYSGFTWELIQKLSARYAKDEALAVATRLTLQAAALNPVGIKSAIENMLLADDDDLDLRNGTPHSKEIVAAARARRIPVPGALPRT